MIVKNDIPEQGVEVFDGGIVDDERNSTNAEKNKVEA